MANNPSTNVTPKEPPTPTVQIPQPESSSLSLLQQPQDPSPQPSFRGGSSPVQSPGSGRTGALSLLSGDEQSPKSPQPIRVLTSPPPTPRTLGIGKSSSSSMAAVQPGRHPGYRGIRSRSGKWVSEIREPRKTTRIWLGTYPTPEMAATAYDVAAIALKGPDTDLNFPDMILSYPKVASTSATDIRAAAASAAAARLPKPESAPSKKDSKKDGDKDKPEKEGAATAATSSSSCMESGSGSGQEFIDEEALLNLPNLLADMAEGMLVSPPRINSTPSDDSPENSDVESLWTYT
ncbi:hypothetical protein COLO4_14254 [Corchorus olitorius]|uniref:AP2/ERF domain-containing protein n=1 Tax=Corchorus olitorius TaxID=93759 RepID=A0A1R3JSV7_9ROSI|nr:hypothetical protein COLO4_14254 [Corchorus olitorius]